MSAQMHVQIVVVDADDNVPRCGSETYTATLDRRTRKLVMDEAITVYDPDQARRLHHK